MLFIKYTLNTSRLTEVPNKSTIYYSRAKLTGGTTTREFSSEGIEGLKEESVSPFSSFYNQKSTR